MNKNNSRHWFDAPNVPGGNPLGSISDSAKAARESVETITQQIRAQRGYVVGDTPSAHTSGSNLASFGGSTGESGSASPSYPDGTTEAGE